jgi:hypothetical protein
MSIPYVIRFIPSNKEKKDDVLKITKLSANSFQWSFADADQHMKQTLVLSPAYNVTERLQTLLELYAADSAPATEMQVDVPGFPTVLFKAADVGKNISLIRESLAHVLYSWPEYDFPTNYNLNPAARCDPPRCDATCDAEPQYDTACDAQEPPRCERRWMRTEGRLRANSNADELPDLIPSYETPRPPRRGKHLFFD